MAIGDKSSSCISEAKYTVISIPILWKPYKTIVVSIVPVDCDVNVSGVAKNSSCSQLLGCLSRSRFTRHNFHHFRYKLGIQVYYAPNIRG